MNTRIVLNSLFIVIVYTSQCVAAEGKEALGAQLLSQPKAVESNTTSQDSKKSAEEIRRSCGNSCGKYMFALSVTGILAMLITSQVIYDAKARHPLCDSYSLTKEDFKKTPNITWSQVFTYCCGKLDSKMIFGDASILLDDNHSDNNLGQSVAHRGWINYCSTYASYEICPSISQGTVDKNSPSYYKNFDPCHRKRQNRVNPAQALKNKFMKRSNKMGNKKFR